MPTTHASSRKAALEHGAERSILAGSGQERTNCNAVEAVREGEVELWPRGEVLAAFRLHGLTRTLCGILRIRWEGFYAATQYQSAP